MALRGSDGLTPYQRERKRHPPRPKVKKPDGRRTAPQVKRATDRWTREFRKAGYEFPTVEEWVALFRRG